MTPIPHTLGAARRAARRALLAGAMRSLGLGLLWSMAPALILVVLDRLIGPLAPLWMLVAAPAAAGAVAGLLIGVARGWSARRAAIEIDDALGLHDALSSAIELHNDNGAFAALATADAERIARDVRVTRVVPLRPGRVWIAWPLAGAACVAIGLYVPRWERSAAADAQADAQAAKVGAVASQLTEARAAAEAALESSPGDAATSEELRALEELERELASESGDPDAVAADAARQLEQIADDLERDAEVAQQANEALQRRLAEASPAADGPAAEFADALADGDLERARDAAKSLLDQVETMSDDERRELADDLAELADQLEQAEPATPDENELAEELQRQGLDEELLEQLLREESPEQVADRLEEEGLDPDVARRLSEQIEEQSRRREAEQRTEREQEALNDALRRTADDIDPDKQPPTDPPPNETDDTPRDPSQPEQPRQPQDEGQRQDEQQQGEQREGAEQSDSQRKQEQGQDQQGDKQQGEQGERTGDEQRQGEQQQEEGEQTQGEQTRREQGEQTQGDRQGAEERTGQQEGQEQDQQGEREAQQGEQGEDATREAPASEAQGESTPGGEPRGAESSQRESLQEQLDRLADQQGQSRRQTENADELRRRAQEMLDNATPEEREQLERLAAQMAKSEHTPTEAPTTTDLFDARTQEQSDQPPAPEQVIAQWYNENGEPGDPVGRAAAAQRMREAAAGAERAIEEQRVPRRHRDLLRRVMRRYAGETEAPARVEDAKDAGAP